MLELLRVQNFALIESLSLRLGDRLTVISGETGAGKSTLIAALKLLRGGRADRRLIRTGTAEAQVEGEFRVSESFVKHAARCGVQIKAQRLHVKRSLKRRGSNLISVNGKRLNMNQLAGLMEQLIEITGQNEHHELRVTSRQLDMIDQAGGIEGEQLAFEVRYSELFTLDKELEQLRALEATRSEREDFLNYQLEELERAGLKDPDEEGKVRTELTRLQHGERLQGAAQRAEAYLYSAQGAAVERLGAALRDLETLSEVDKSIDALREDLQTALLLTEEVARSLDSYRGELRSDPARLDELQHRLALLSSLQRKYGAPLSRVLERQSELEAERQRFEGASDRLAALTEKRKVLGEALLEHARALSERRQQQSLVFCDAVARELHDLGMAKAQLSVRFEPISQGVEVAGQLVGPRGLDRITLEVSANPGEPPMPLHKVASGGELSRLTLAIKRVIAARDPVGVYIFDEVDSGVGGPTADALGRKLRLVSDERQVFVITHLPQVAAIGDQHLLVHKEIFGERTKSLVKVLSEKARVEELARMLSGAQITETTRAGAQELLSLTAR